MSFNTILNKTNLFFINGVIVGLALGYLFFNNPPGKNLSNQNKPKGKICLIIDDFGYSENDLTRDFLSLDNDFTISIIPGHKYSEDIAHLASKYGFETIVHMPLEPFNWDGETEKKYQLTSKMNFDEVFLRVENAFNEIPSAVGMNNHQGSKASENLQLLKNLARSLKVLDKYFIDSYTSTDSRAFITMRQHGVKTDVRQLFLDHEENPDSVRNKINQLIQMAGKMDIVVGIGHVKLVTYNILKEEIPRLKKEGYEFLNASEIVR